MNPPRPLWKSVQDYVMIAIGMISYAIGWNVFLLPTNVTASGLPGISSIIYWATGCPVQIPYFIANATLLICAFKILGAKFCVKTVYAVIVVTALTSFFSSRLGDIHLLENQPLWAAFLGAVFCGCGIGLGFSVGGSTGGTAVSAAATPIENNVKKKPSNCPGKRMRLNTAKFRSAAFNTSSMEMSMATRLRRVQKP
jgi:uncharacterized membrane-anchored protein YitT (DUF2179 family)